MSVEAYIYDTDDVKAAEKVRVFTVDELAAVPAMDAVEPQNYIISCDMAATADFTARLDRRVFLSIIYGHNITNNWLKRHGGVMSRKIHRRYRV